MPKITTKIDDSKFKDYILDLLKNKSNKETYEIISQKILERTRETHTPRALRWYYCNKIAPDQKYPALEVIKKTQKDKILLEVMDDLNQCRKVARERLERYVKLEREMNLSIKETSEAIKTLIEADDITMNMLFDLGIFTKVLPSVYVESTEDKPTAMQEAVKMIFDPNIIEEVRRINHPTICDKCQKDIKNQMNAELGITS